MIIKRLGCYRHKTLCSNIEGMSSFDGSHYIKTLDEKAEVRLGYSLDAKKKKKYQNE